MTASWWDVLPARERKGTVAEMQALELLIRDAAMRDDRDALAAAAAAWSLLGWGPNYLVWTIADIAAFTDEDARRRLRGALRRRHRALLRAQARGVAFALAGLQSAQVVDEAYLSQRTGAWWQRLAETERVLRRPSP